MRCVAGAGLLALVGCNQIFGITPTQPYDAAPDVPADLPHVVLDWQIATVFAAGTAQPGAPNPTPGFAPIDPAPRIRLALLNDPAMIDAGNPMLPALAAASYSSSDGFIAIPRDYLTQPWRLEYTLADNIPHEVQWLPDDKQGHLTLPMFGRLQRDAPPTGSGYQITPSNHPALYGFPRVFTTGLWSEGVIIPPPTTTTINYDFSAATSLSGAIARPDPALGDQALVVDYITDGATNCHVAVGSAPVTPATLQASAHSVVTATWDTGRKAVKSDAVDLSIITRLNDGLGKLGSFNSMNSFQLFGSAASTDMPGLAGAPAGSKLESVLMPVPVMITLLTCPYTQSPLPLTAQPSLLDAFPRVLNVQLASSRTSLGATLISGMETVVTAPASATVGLKIAFPAPIPTTIRLTTPASTMVDLGGDTDQVAIGPASGTFTLGFTPEVGADLRGDYFDVVLHRIAGGNLTTERIYTVTAPTVRIDGSLLTPGADYVFEIRSYKGHPRAQHGDFTAVDYPYGLAIAFTRTFKAS